jgi:hypothetical protein
MTQLKNPGGRFNILEIRDRQLNLLVSIDEDGVITYGPTYNPDDTAKKLWVAVATHRDRSLHVQYDADLDGNCENCGLLIGFNGTHTLVDCVRELKEKLAQKFGDASYARVDEAMKLLRKAFRDDGAESESVHLICREVDRLRAEIARPMGSRNDQVEASGS